MDIDTSFETCSCAGEQINRESATGVKEENSKDGRCCKGMNATVIQ